MAIFFRLAAVRGLPYHVAMQQVATKTRVAYELRLQRARVPASERPDYHKWTRFYLDFCHKYSHEPRSPTSLGPFLSKLAAKNQSVEQRQQAAQAIRLLIGSHPEPTANFPARSAKCPPSTSATSALNSPVVAPRPVTPKPRPIPQPGPPPFSSQPPTLNPLHAATAPAPGHGASWQQEYRDLEAAILTRNYSTRTLETYRFWIVKFQAFVRSRPTAGLGNQEVRGFLSELAVRRRVAASLISQEILVPPMVALITTHHFTLFLVCYIPGTGAAYALSWL